MAATYTFPASSAQVAASTTFPEVKLAGNIYTLACDATSSEGFMFVVPHLGTLAASSMTVLIDWYADTATSNAVVWDAAALAYTVGTDSSDIEAKAFATAVPGSATTASGTAQVPVRTTITLTTGAQQDSAVTGDYFALRIRRLPADGGDTMAGDAQVIGVQLSF